MTPTKPDWQQFDDAARIEDITELSWYCLAHDTHMSELDEWRDYLL